MEETRVILLDKYDYRLTLNALNELRTVKLEQGIDIEIIDKLIMKLLNAPVKNKKQLSLNRKVQGIYTHEGR